MDPYDSFPYESIAFPETHPANLAVLGRLFGLETADPDCCRVLELGCASGGNLIPMAWYLPGSEFLGIDLSGRQIEDGQAQVTALSLSNIELRQGDILQLGEELGEFDYLIVHGVLSWVPEAVRAHLLELAPRLLAPAGLCYLSYNCLPGWRMRGMLRDILLYACRDATTPPERLDAARAALRRLAPAVEGLEALSARYLAEEVRNLRDAHPSYLFFEYLAEHNRAFLFAELAAQFDRNGLRYLCDTDLRTLFPSTYGEAVDRTLEDIEDGLELEQWLDFITNRNFRQSVLCRAEARLEDEIDLERFARLSFRADLRLRGKSDPRRIEGAAFLTPGGNPLNVSHPLTRALLTRLVALYPNSVPLAELMPGAARQVAAAAGGELASQVNECLAELFSLFAHRAVAARPRPLRTRIRDPERPKASALAAAQVRSGARRVATVHHGNLDLDSFAARLLLHLDGSNTPGEAAQRLAADLRAGDLPPPEGEDPSGWSEERLQARTSAAVKSLLALFARYGVLDSEIRGD